MIRKRLDAGLVDIARAVASEIAWLGERGWRIEPPGEEVGFVLRKSFVYPVGEEFDVIIRERPGEDPLCRLTVAGKPVDAADETSLMNMIEDDGCDEVRRALRLLEEVLGRGGG